MWGRYCYVISFDVAGAFDNVPHAQLMGGLERMGVDGHTRRVIHTWLRDRTFQLRMRTPAGDFYSSIHKITKGLPQGGVLSPLPWIVLRTRLEG